MRRIESIFFGFILLAPLAVRGGLGTFSGREYYAWRERSDSLIIARLATVKAIPPSDEDARVTYAAVLEPLATLAGHFDPSAKTTLDVRIWDGDGSSVPTIPAAGSLVLAVIVPPGFDDKPHPFMVVETNSCSFMPDHRALVAINGFSDDKVTSTMARVRDARAHADRDPDAPATQRAGVPRSSVFDAGENARQIVFLCNATGRMLQNMATLKDQVNKAVADLNPEQSFNIIFYQEDAQVFQEAMVPATPAHKRQAGAYLEKVTCLGDTDPIPSMIVALKLRPDLIYFVTDADDFPDPDGLLKIIATYDKDNRTKINPILFVQDKTEHARNADGESFMKSIAKKTGGRFKWVEIDAIRK
ncbi:MAG TPA: hypothetical protein VFC46_10335 [Humisphaera sp.]|nr:hypothetical protein [Humisphaera sp.]